MPQSDLRRCHDHLSQLVTTIEAAARALGEGLAAAPGDDPVAALGHLQVNDLTVQRCAHGRDALAVLAGLDDPVLVALGCRLQARQLELAHRDYATAVTALRQMAPAAAQAGQSGIRLEQDAARLAGVVASLEVLAGSAAPAPEVAAHQRAKLVEQLKPTYTMASERAILAHFLTGESPPAATAAAADDDGVEDCFL